MIFLRHVIVTKITKTIWTFAVNKIANNPTNKTCNEGLINRMTTVRARVLHVITKE